MRVFANLFLILFLADGGFSLVDELVSLLTPLLPFTDFRNFLAGMVIVMSVPLYFSLGIDHRLPKRVFLPLLIFVFWTVVSTGLFPVLAGIRVYGLVLAAVQVLLGMLPLLVFRDNDHGRLTMPSALFAQPYFTIRNCLTFFGANLLVLPLALALFAIAVANAYMAEYTAGFMHLHPSGLRMTERTYTRDNRTIRLAAMIHVGTREYYQEMAGSVTPGSTIVLAEGVSDSTNRLRNRLDYGKVAGFIGLASQDKLLFKGRMIDEEEFTAPVPPAAVGSDAHQNREPDIFRADVDMSTFRPTTITFLDAIGKQMQESKTFAGGILALNKWAEKNVTPEMYEIIMDDILHRRNVAVLGHMDRALARYDTVIIPWGALHMKEIESEVLKRGFVLQKEQERVSIDAGKLLSERI